MMNSSDALAKALAIVFDKNSRSWSETTAEELLDALMDEGYVLVATSWGEEMYERLGELDNAMMGIREKLAEQVPYVG